MGDTYNFPATNISYWEPAKQHSIPHISFETTIEMAPFMERNISTGKVFHNIKNCVWIETWHHEHNDSPQTSVPSVFSFGTVAFCDESAWVDLIGSIEKFLFKP